MFLKFKGISTSEPVWIIPSWVSGIERVALNEVLTKPDGFQEHRPTGEYATVLHCWGTTFYIQETPAQVIAAIGKCQKMSEDRAINLHKRLGREDWQEGDDESY